MGDCRKCKHHYCSFVGVDRGGLVECANYLHPLKPTKPITNADRIRAMSDEELAAWIAGMTTVCECCAELNECEAPRGFNRCSHGVEDWLKQPYEGE